MQQPPGQQQQKQEQTLQSLNQSINQPTQPTNPFTCMAVISGCTVPSLQPRSPIIGLHSCRPSRRRVMVSVSLPSSLASCSHSFLSAGPCWVGCLLAAAAANRAEKLCLWRQQTEQGEGEYCLQIASSTSCRALAGKTCYVTVCAPSVSGQHDPSGVQMRSGWLVQSVKKTHGISTCTIHHSICSTHSFFLSPLHFKIPHSFPPLSLLPLPDPSGVQLLSGWC